jgi:hypothetical protein
MKHDVLPFGSEIDVFIAFFWLLSHESITQVVFVPRKQGIQKQDKIWQTWKTRF